MKGQIKWGAAVGSAAVLLGVVGQYVFAASTSILVPTSDGTYADWTPKSGAIHYTMVDETPCNGTTDHNRETTVGGRDSYVVSLASVPDTATITQVDVVPCASRQTSGGGSSQLDVFYRFNGVDSADAGAYALPTGLTPQELATTTFSGLVLDKSAASTFEIGAVYTSGNRGVRLSRLATVLSYELLTAPASLDVLTATSSSALQITWSDLSTYEDGFAVERATSTMGTWLNIATTTPNKTSIGNSGLSPNTQYCYRVRAFNGGGYSTYSNTDCEITLP